MPKHGKTRSLESPKIVQLSVFVQKYTQFALARKTVERLSDSGEMMEVERPHLASAFPPTVLYHLHQD
jgi:hypothetical protein